MAAGEAGAGRGAVEVVPVDSRALWRAFHDLPANLYKADPHWVPPLRLERRLHFSPAHNPFFKHARAAFWLARRDGVPVGRITAQIDELHLRQHGDATGHFGFIEAIDDAEVFAALLATAERWLADNGMRRVLGPVSFSMWDEPGLLVDGFDSPPNVMMGHALPYYQQRIAALGYAPAQDLLAYSYDNHAPLPDKLGRLVERARQKRDFVFRPIAADRRRQTADIAAIRDVLNDAWAENWGFVPITEAEVADIAVMFRYLLEPDALVIAEYAGEVAGVGMMLPNLNELIADLGGKLLPFGFLKLYWRLKTHRARSGRLALLGVRRKWWDSPMGAIMALMIIEQAKASNFARGVRTAELSWILDSNVRIKAVLAEVGATVSKRYRIYEKTLG